MRFIKQQLLLLGILLWLPFQQEVFSAKYYIYKIEGKIMQLKNDKWVSPSLRDEINIRDKFDLREGAILAIADKESHRVYYTKEEGIQNVAQIISTARKQSDKISKLTFQQALASMKGDTKNVSVFGVVSRGTNSSVDTTHLIYAYLYNIIKQRSYVKKQTNLYLSCVQCDNQWCFNVKNDYNEPLFFNILRLPSEKQKPLLCIDFISDNDTPYIIANPNSEVCLIQYPYVKTDESYEYLLFATDCPFDSQALRILLDSNAAPQKTDNEIKIFTSYLFY